MNTIRIGNSGVSYSGSVEDLGALREQFDRQHYVKLPKLLDPALLDVFQPQIQEAEFYEKVHEGIGENKELCMANNTVSAALLFMMNDRSLFRLIQTVTGCDEIGCFQGRVYRVAAESRHHDSWHNDIGEQRLVGMSLNLSTEAFAGGVLQIRNHASGEIVSEVPNAGSGDAVIFRLSNDLQHRITNVEGTISKTALAGWFRAQPDFRDLLKQRSHLRREATLSTQSAPAFHKDVRQASVSRVVSTSSSSSNITGPTLECEGC